MEESKSYKIEVYAGDGELEKLKEVLGEKPTQDDLDLALINAIAYSQIKVADMLLSLGADFSKFNYQSVYYAVHNDELEGLKYAISQGIDINVNEGMILNTSILTAINNRSTKMVSWILEAGANSKYLSEKSLNLISKYCTDELKERIRNVIK